MRDQRPGIHFSDTDDIVRPHVLIQATLRHQPRKLLLQVPADQPPDLYTRRFHIAILHSVIADMYAVHDQHLPIIAGIGKDLLVTRHSGVEADLAGSGASLAKGLAIMNSAVFK